MKLTGLTSLLCSLPEIEALGQYERGARVFGLLQAAKPAVIAALVNNRTEPLLVVTAHSQSAHDLALELGCWSTHPVLYFPAMEALPYERVFPDRELLSARENVLRTLGERTPVVVVAPVRALLQPVHAPMATAPETTVTAGGTVRLDTLLAAWVSGGYTEVSLVDGQGTFARRGGVIDVFPAGTDRPVRIELFGHDVESLRTFDPATQRSIEAVTDVTIPPIAALDEEARLGALDTLMSVDTGTMNAEARTLWDDDLGRLEAGASLDELALFAPYLVRSPTSLVDHFPATAPVVLDDAGETVTALSELWDQSLDVQRGLEESGNLPAGLKPALLDPGTVTQMLQTRCCIEFHGGSATDEDAQDLGGLFTPAHLYAGRLRAFENDMRTGSDQRRVIASLQYERLEELLRDIEVTIRRVDAVTEEPGSGVTLVGHPITQGWMCPGLDLTVLSDHEIFGRSLARPVVRKKRAARESFFTVFSPGDYVVHLEHGIGRFVGVTRMAIEGAEREYALVQYAGADKVYVPTDQLERLTRYVGSGDTAPQLSKLGGAEWQRARQRAKQAAAEIAHELIDLYAKRRTRTAHAFSEDLPWQHELETSFPYPETPDQLRAVEDVKADMEAPHPMDRLVCADVGYGKTEVAVRAAFKSVMDGKQVAVLVPTTILAQQHFETFSERFSAFPVKVEALSRFRSAAQQKEILRTVGTGEVDVVIGTHRLLSKDVAFKNLGLLIVDEEQRFGVKHKEQLKKMREAIDVLTLTATPIPRTLHSGLVGIREISVIETPPEGRLPIKTYLQPYDDRLMREAVLRELDRDGQVYVVHNKVTTIEAVAEKVRQLVPEARVLVAHGQMDDALLERVMLAFAHHEADVLICSTIIENGLDIPNVNSIVVNNAHRLGLTQLYQLRGRVGRSANQAYAYLLYPLDVRLSHDAVRRMEAVFEAQDLGAGFSIAMKDLEIRGTGNLLGAEQSGHAEAIGFDLYTRMIGDAVERLRGVQVDEPPSITMNLPLTMYLPEDYVGSEAERLTLYRRLANVTQEAELEELREEMRDRFGPLPVPVQNLATTVRLKLLARDAHVMSVSVDADTIAVRAQPHALYDRVSLYRRYGTEARISNALLKVPRRLAGPEWIEAIATILREMAALHGSIPQTQPVGA